MAAADATAFPIYGQAFRFDGVIISAATLNPITGGLTGLQSQISKDGGAFTNCITNATEIGTTGYIHIDLSAAEMTATSILVRVTASNAGAVEFPQPVTPLRIGEFTGRADAQTPKRWEQYLQDVVTFLYNYNFVDGSSYVIQNTDTTTKVSGSIQKGDTSAVRTRLS